MSTLQGSDFGRRFESGQVHHRRLVHKLSEKTLKARRASVGGLPRFRRDQRTANSCRVLWPTLRDTETKTATERDSAETAKVIAVPARTMELQLAAERLPGNAGAWQQKDPQSLSSILVSYTEYVNPVIR